MRYPIIVALDGKSVEESARLIDATADLVWGFKFNDLFLHPGVDDLIIKAEAAGARAFIDLKLHDIPNTVANQIKRLNDRLPVSESREPVLVTVHTSGGDAMLQSAMEATGQTRIKILGVTVLTSLKPEDSVGIYGKIPEKAVVEFAEKASNAKLWGVVCSPLEIEALSRIPKSMHRVVPGIRPEWHTTPDDQSRTSTPSGAVRSGANLLVIGRPITAAADPAKAVRMTGQELLDAHLICPECGSTFTYPSGSEWDLHCTNCGHQWSPPPGIGSAEFLKVALRNEWLKFGEFTLKSGRLSPYFFNTGSADTGETMGALAQFYGKKIAGFCRSLIETKGPKDRQLILAGPAYKGIPLVVAIADYLAAKEGINLPWCFDRKEEKAHGDKGAFVGRNPVGCDVIIVDDVITTGATKIEFAKKLAQSGANPIACVVAFDRDEVTAGDTCTAVQAFTESTGVDVLSVARFSDLEGVADEDVRAKLASYREEYGS